MNVKFYDFFYEKNNENEINIINKLFIYLF